MDQKISFCIASWCSSSRSMLRYMCRTRICSSWPRQTSLLAHCSIASFDDGASALLATMAGLYAVYHGEEGIKNIASEIHYKTALLNETLIGLGIRQTNKNFFDTLCIELDSSIDARSLEKKSIDHRVNFRYFNEGDHVGISIDETTSFEDLKPPWTSGTIVINPPYGERMQQREISRLYRNIGDTLKRHYAGSDCWILSSNKEALKHVGLQASKKMTLYNGPIEVKFQRYVLYEGSKKQKKN